MANAPHALRVELKDLMANQLSPEELDILIYELDINDLPVRPTHSLKAQEVVGYLDRRMRLADLAEAGERVRKDLPWVEILSRYGYGPKPPPPAPPPLPEPPAPPPTEVSHLDLQKLVPILAEVGGFQAPGSRHAFLKYAGVDKFVNGNLDGGARMVAMAVLTELNLYGRTRDGDLALGRLLAALLLDDAISPARQEVIAEIVARYGLDKTA